MRQQESELLAVTEKEMGAYLSEPVLEKHSTDEENAVLSYGASSMQGWRVSQEVSSEQSPGQQLHSTMYDAPHLINN